MAGWLPTLVVWTDTHPARVRAALWGALGLACFAAAGYLTWTIAHVTTAMSAVAPDRIETDPRGWYALGVLGDAGERGTVQAAFDYTTEDDVATLSFVLPPGSQTLVLRGATEWGCRREWPGQGDPRGDALPRTDVGDAEAFNLREAAADADPRVTCNLWPRYLRDSFTTIASVFYSDNRTLDPFEEQKYLPIELIVNGRDGPVDITASNHASLSDAPVIRPGGNVFMRFHSMRAEEARDWHILWIGVLVGFGAAMVIEVIRPLIEAIGGRRMAMPASGGAAQAVPDEAAPPAPPPAPPPGG